MPNHIKYHLKGQCSIIQHCYETHPGLPTLTCCPEPGACEGHRIMLDVAEIVKIENVDNEDEIMEASLKQYGGLEPIWEVGPAITELPIEVSIDKEMAQYIRDKGYICEINPFAEVVNGVPPAWLPEEELYKYGWYLTNCPLEHGKEVEGLMLLGSMVFKAEDYPKVLEEAKAMYEAHLASFKGKRRT